MRLRNLTLALVVLLFIGLSSVSAADTNATQSPAPAPTPVQMKVKAANVYETRNEAGIGDRLIVEVENLSDAILKDKINPRELVLYLDGRELKEVKGVPTEAANMNKLLFVLRRTEQNREVWSTLLGRPTLQNVKVVPVSVGFPDKQAFPFSTVPVTMNLRVYQGWWAVVALIALILAIVLFVWLARRGYLIHDSNPPAPPAGTLKPYSLALTQAAVWFFLVVGSFLLIYLITGDYNTITDQALILMGIGTGTALGAAMIDATKRDTSNNDLSALKPEAAKLQAEVAELTQQQTDLQAKVANGTATADDQSTLKDVNIALQEKQATLAEKQKAVADAEAGLTKPVSEGFRRDLLTDANGITLHRFQIVVWTVVLAVLFVIGVYKDLAMPEFSATLLALMGISSGTYLGFKIPERQN